MFSCDYNGWTDVPEEEREAIEAFELSTDAGPELARRVVPVPALPPQHIPRRKAA